MRWRILDTGSATAAQNMAIDRALLKDLAHNPEPLLHLYDWNTPSITHGYFIDPYAHLNRHFLEEKGLQISSRPTGGGIVLHFNDFAFSILLPKNYPGYSLNTLENYALVHRLVAKSLQAACNLDTAPSLFACKNSSCMSIGPDFCMASPSPYDVVWQGKKIAGGAQRRSRHGLLHQGTICTHAPEEDLVNMLVKNEKTAEAILNQTTCLTLEKDSFREAFWETLKGR